MRRSASSDSVEITEAAPRRFSVRGPLTFGTARRARESGIRAFNASGNSEVEIDCSEVTQADSAGLAVLLDWLAWGRKNGRRLRLTNLPEPIQAVARISEVEGLLEEGTGARL
jgi:phospholipid transport system transporter-binding protein